MKLVYFNAKGLAETSRIILAIAGQQYEDFRYPIEVIDPVNHVYKREEFEADKASGLLDRSLGKLPYLVTDNGQIICQSKSIERYLSYKFGLMGSSAEENAKIDSICEIIRDYKEAYMKLKYGGASEEAIAEYFQKTLPKNFIDLGKLLSERGSDKKFSVGNKLSLADISLYTFVTQFFTDVSSSYKACCKSIRIRVIVDNVASMDSVKNWIATRPNTFF